MKEIIENEELKQYQITIIGAGGIGSHLIGNLIPALHRGSLWEHARMTVRVYDSDIVSTENTAHQRFSSEHIGMHKVNAISESLSHYLDEGLEIEPCAWDVREPNDISSSDLVVVAVDSHEARMAVHSNGGLWLDLRCRGDGFIALDFRVGEDEVSEMTPRQQSASCQLDGAIETGNIQFGHLSAAAHGAQWVVQCMRALVGGEMAMPPLPQAANITLGTLSRIETRHHSEQPEVLEENPPTIPVQHSIHHVFHDIDQGKQDSQRALETISDLALRGEWRSLWEISHRMDREISALIDSDGRVYVDIGSRGEVRLAPPTGASIPFRTWIHTHPMDAYWSETDRETLAICSGILDEAVVLGHDHYMRTSFADHQDRPLGQGMLMQWSSEPRSYYKRRS